MRKLKVRASLVLYCAAMLVVTIMSDLADVDPTMQDHPHLSFRKIPEPVNIT